MLLQYCAPLHLQFLNVRLVCAGLLHLEHKTVDLSVKSENQDVFFIPSRSFSHAIPSIAFYCPCFAALVQHYRACANDCSTLVIL